jgi:YggT family protein
MFILGNFIAAVATILNYLLSALYWLIIIRALLSWVSPDPFNPIVRFINAVTEPMLEPFRRIIPSYKIGIDLSPIFALVLVWFLKLFLISSLMGIAARLS